jgi:hypothetical protein
MATPFTSPTAAKQFMLGGKSFTTLVSSASGQRFTYKIELADKKNPTDVDCFFVSVLNGPDNWVNYKYIGIIKNNEYRWTAKSKIAEEAPSVKAFKFCFGHLSKNTIIGFEVWHEGKCGRCGRKLTVPESIASGFGPECIGMIGMPSTMAAAVGGTAAPQSKLEFSGQPIVHGTKQTKMSGTAAAQALYAPAANTNLDAEIQRRIEIYKTLMPEDYTQDGILTEEEAQKVAYNKFRVEVLHDQRKGV